MLLIISLYDNIYSLEFSTYFTKHMWEQLLFIKNRISNNYCYDICLILWVTKYAACCRMVTFKGSFSGRQVVWPSVMLLSLSAKQVVQNFAYYAWKRAKKKTGHKTGQSASYYLNSSKDSEIYSIYLTKNPKAVLKVPASASKHLIENNQN